MQILSLGATSAQGEDPPWVVLDGAHTPASAQALVSTLAEVHPWQITVRASPSCYAMKKQLQLSFCTTASGRAKLTQPGWLHWQNTCIAEKPRQAGM